MRQWIDVHFGKYGKVVNPAQFVLLWMKGRVRMVQMPRQRGLEQAGDGAVGQPQVAVEEARVMALEAMVVVEVTGR